jgi:hypothetical protein
MRSLGRPESPGRRWSGTWPSPSSTSARGSMPWIDLPGSRPLRRPDQQLAAPVAPAEEEEAWRLVTFGLIYEYYFRLRDL